MLPFASLGALLAVLSDLALKRHVLRWMIITPTIQAGWISHHSQATTDLVSVLSRYSNWSGGARQTHRTLHSVTTCRANRAFLALNRRKSVKEENQ